MRSRRLGTCLIVLLLLAILPTGSLAQRKRQPDVEVIAAEFAEAYRTGNWERAIETGIQLAELRPTNVNASYNLACVYGLSGDADNCVLWLRDTAKDGFWRIAHVEADGDLDSVRGHPDFAAALKEIQENYDRKRKELRRKFNQRPPLITVPPNYSKRKPAPLLIALHGYGGVARGYPSYWKNAAAQAGAILVIPQGVERVSGKGFSWGHVDQAEILIELTLERARRKCAVDEENIVLTGFSQGGYIVAALGARYPDRYAGIIPMGNPYIPAIDEPDKIAVDAGKPRFYFMVGEHDGMRPQSEQAYRDYAKAGNEVELRVYPGAGHTFPRRNDEELGKALAWVLGDEPPLKSTPEAPSVLPVQP